MPRRRTPEGKILAECLRTLKKWGIPAWRNSVGRFGPSGAMYAYGKVGSSDILGVHPGPPGSGSIGSSGRILAIETKVPGGQLTPKQYEFLDEIRWSGGIAVVVESAEDLRRILSRLHDDPSAVFDLPERPRPRPKAKGSRKGAKS